MKFTDEQFKELAAREDERILAEFLAQNGDMGGSRVAKAMTPHGEMIAVIAPARWTKAEMEDVIAYMIEKA